MKNVQIPEDLFWELCRFHLGEPLEADEAADALERIDEGLRNKLEAMQRRALYSIYKDTKASPKDREAARQAYLDMVGMLPGYRWAGLDPPE